MVAGFAPGTSSLLCWHGFYYDDQQPTNHFLSACSYWSSTAVCLVIYSAADLNWGGVKGVHEKHFPTTSSGMDLSGIQVRSAKLGSLPLTSLALLDQQGPAAGGHPTVLAGSYDNQVSPEYCSRLGASPLPQSSLQTLVCAEFPRAWWQYALALIC